MKKKFHERTTGSLVPKIFVKLLATKNN